MQFCYSSEDELHSKRRHIIQLMNALPTVKLFAFEGRRLLCIAEYWCVWNTESVLLLFSVTIDDMK